MTQEVRVMLQLTLDVHTELSKKDIEGNIKNRLETLSNLTGFYVQMVDIIEIREEAEIYGTEESDAVKEYNKKYHIDTKRQTKINF